MTSEEKYGVTAQPEPGCPIINELRRNLDRADECFRFIHQMNEAELRESAQDAMRWIDFARDESEQARARMEEIRGWGQEWKDEAKSALAELERIEQPAP